MTHPRGVRGRSSQKTFPVDELSQPRGPLRRVTTPVMLAPELHPSLRHTLLHPVSRPGIIANIFSFSM